jgi:hypothetical protein
MPVSLPSSPKYSLIWAQSIVNQALEKHARVSVSFLRFTGLSRHQLALLLAAGRPEWNILRDLLKTADRWLDKQASLGMPCADGITTQMYSALLKINRHRLPEKLYNHLDRQLELIDH